MKRMVIAVLSFGLLVSPGCQSGADRAGRHRQLVDVGMTRDQVEERLGEPDGWEENVNGYEVWAYSYRPNAGTFFVWRTVDLAAITVALALVFGVFYLIFEVCRAHLSGPPPSPSSSVRSPSAPQQKDARFQRFVFRIGFNPETGRVAFVSSPLPE